ncbi:MAG: cyclic pyranopterin monophosphate synthase MoaC [Planctomycetota bacterium]|nr:MAG: cyclic pyranopterin monophosphate synthase MoaC [Planctomycetota bacterium]
MSDTLTHLNEHGAVRMVDVGAKPATRRTATAEAFVRCSGELLEAIRANSIAKGDLLAAARIAGVMAAKRVGSLIPLCHTLPIESATVDIALESQGVRLLASVATTAKTGVEMEALTAAAVAALTVIDMGKAIDRAMTIERVRLLEKTGGRQGDYHADDISPHNEDTS